MRYLGKRAVTAWRGHQVLLAPPLHIPMEKNPWAKGDRADNSVTTRAQVNTHWAWGARKRKITSLPLGKGQKNHPGLRQFMVSHCCERHMVSEKDPPTGQDDGLHRACLRLVEPRQQGTCTPLPVPPQPDQVSRIKKDKSPAREQKEQEWDLFKAQAQGESLKLEVEQEHWGNTNLRGSTLRIIVST